MKTTRKTTQALLRGLVLLAVFAGQAVAQTWIQQFPGGTPPTSRYSVGQAYDAANDRLILFSGDDNLGLPRPTDVWILTNATGAAPGWMQLFPTGGPPFGRFGTTEVYAPTSNRIIVHAGCGGNCTPMLNDTWVLTNANGLGGAPAWINLPSAPVARGEHAAVYDDANNRMIIFGGHTGFPTTERNDVWVLTNADGTGGTPTWIQLFPAGVPPTSRRPYSMAYDPATNRLIIFGGLNTIPCCSVNVFNDVWVLTNANGLGGAPLWIQLAPLGTPPAARAAHTVVYDSGSNRMTLFAGNEGVFPPPPFNDVWVITGANGLGVPQWVQLNPNGGPPIGRALHTAGFNPASNRMVIAMGSNGALPFPSVLNDVWVLTNANGIIKEVTVCHKPGAPAQKTLVIPASALAGHLGHGDTIGACR